MHIHPIHTTAASKLTTSQSLVQEPSDVQYKRVDKLLLKLLDKFPYKALASKVSVHGRLPCMVLL